MPDCLNLPAPVVKQAVDAGPPLDAARLHSNGGLAQLTRLCG